MGWRDDRDHSHTYDQRWGAFYARVYGDCRVERIADLDQQRAGLDAIVHVPGACFGVDEKVRPGWSKNDDVLIEVKLAFDDGRQEFGWATDPKKDTDVVAYAVPALDWACLFLYKPLRNTLMRAPERFQRCPRKRSRKNNDDYEALNLAIPVGALSDVTPFWSGVW